MSNGRDFEATERDRKGRRNLAVKSWRLPPRLARGSFLFIARRAPATAHSTVGPRSARMMQWLLAHGADYSIEVVGNRVLVAGPKIPPTELLQVIGTAKAFVDHVPKVVFSLYPVSG